MSDASPTMTDVSPAYTDDGIGVYLDPPGPSRRYRNRARRRRARRRAWAVVGACAASVVLGAATYAALDYRYEPADPERTPPSTASLDGGIDTP